MNAKQRPDFGPTIERLKQIAADSGHALLTEGPVHPDHVLLDMCATALHHLGHAQKAHDARGLLTWFNESDPKRRDEMLATYDRLFEEYKEGERRGKPYLLNIAKLKAQTPAGIYAKAAVVRASKTGAAGLAMSLARDLLDCPEMRAVLWPAQRAEG